MSESRRDAAYSGDQEAEMEMEINGNWPAWPSSHPPNGFTTSTFNGQTKAFNWRKYEELGSIVRETRKEDAASNKTVSAQKEVFTELERLRYNSRKMDEEVNALKKIIDEQDAKLREQNKQLVNLQQEVETYDSQIASLKAQERELAELRHQVAALKVINVSCEEELNSELNRLNEDRQILKNESNNFATRTSIAIQNIQNELNKLSELCGNTTDNFKWCESIWKNDAETRETTWPTPSKPFENEFIVVDREMDDMLYSYLTEWDHQTPVYVRTNLRPESLYSRRLSNRSCPHFGTLSTGINGAYKSFSNETNVLLNTDIDGIYQHHMHPLSTTHAQSEHNLVGNRMNTVELSHEKPYIAKIPAPHPPPSFNTAPFPPSTTPNGVKLPVHQHAVIQQHSHGMCHISYPCWACPANLPMPLPYTTPPPFPPPMVPIHFYGMVPQGSPGLYMLNTNRDLLTMQSQTATLINELSLPFQHNMMCPPPIPMVCYPNSYSPPYGLPGTSTFDDSFSSPPPMSRNDRFFCREHLRGMRRSFSRTISLQLLPQKSPTMPKENEDVPAQLGL